MRSGNVISERVGDGWQAALTIALVMAPLVLACATDRGAPEATADQIFYGGSILTMERDQREVEAIAISGGRILASGSFDAMQRHRGAKTKLTDLADRTLMPGFIDSHSHLVFTAIKMAVVAMDPPPAGEVQSIDDIIARFRAELRARPADSRRWLVGWGYDNAMLAENRHPTRHDLDVVSREVPILLMHFSTHQVVANSKALELAGISSASKDPLGGVIRRESRSGEGDSATEPNGVLEEKAMFPVLAAASRAGREEGAASSDQGSAFDLGIPSSELPGLIEAAMHHYAANGFTTVLEAAATPKELGRLRALESEGRMPIDVIALPVSWSATAEDVRSAMNEELPREVGRLRVGGAKLILDGGSPGRTAFLREPYHFQEPGESDYRGYPAIADQGVIDDLIGDYYSKNVPLFVHALGDAAVDQAIHAIDLAEARFPKSDRRTQLIHVQQVQPDQIEALAKLDVTLTFQVAHNYYFGDFHESNTYGPARTARLNPAREAIDHGLSVSIHHDSPVHPVDQLLLIWSAVNRVTRSGRVIGPDQRLAVWEALEASTIHAAHQLFEAERKGSLRPGKLADLVVLDRNPLDVSPMEIREIRVVETYKEGVRIFVRP